MKSIGGYFELELCSGEEFHPAAIKLNSGRSAFQYLLEAGSYRKVYLPRYSCEAIFEPVETLSLEFEFYSIDRNFEAIFDFSRLESDSCFLYTNYFGLKDDYLQSLAKTVKNLIIDNAQAFYAAPLPGVDTFYSARKFFGVPDGAYLYTEKLINRELKRDVSFNHAAHLLKRSDLSAEDGYAVYLENEKRFSLSGILLMSKLTQNILSGIDYKRIALQRRNNFQFLNDALSKLNPLFTELKENQVLLSYPFYSTNSDLRRTLIANKIYTAQYWSNVLEHSDSQSIEYDYANNLIHLPIDQRLTTEDLNKIIEVIKL